MKILHIDEGDHDETFFFLLSRCKAVQELIYVGLSRFADRFSLVRLYNIIQKINCIWTRDNRKNEPETVFTFALMSQNNRSFVR